jgi:hypothetical protein
LTVSVRLLRKITAAPAVMAAAKGSHAESGEPDSQARETNTTASDTAIAARACRAVGLEDSRPARSGTNSVAVRTP